MKNKIVFKLSIYFAAALLAFALLISFIYIYMFKANTIKLYKNELEQSALKISEALTSIEISGANKGQGSGYGAYIKFLNDVAMTDVWVVDKDLNILTNNKNNLINNISELPSNAAEIVEEVLNGKTEFSENFSYLLNTPTLTVGTPIKSDNGTIIGAVLLHSPIEGVNSATLNGILILIISISIAFIAAIILSIRFSVIFTNPLKKMNTAAINLASGDYLIKTDIKQNDEIGMLAKNMDILAQRLYDSSKESEKLEQMRKDFTANISHELRTPITVIRGSLEALNDGIITEEMQIKEYYSQMLFECEHLQRLVGDLLDLSKLQNIDFKLEISKINIKEIIFDIVRTAKNLAIEKNVKLLVENNVKDSFIMGDYGRLRQMIIIIVDNAIKFSPQNGHIYIKLYKDKTLNLSIRDEGNGISDDELPFIFDRFYKTKSVENRNGTGLGLAIAKQIAIRHNALITATSKTGIGSEFIITFNNE